ncbi:hypothetical protein AF335_21195 [Streptomyces eurocidicus]|uniref:Peptidase inhibitor family I36 n=1 Tax=Streptomyces eurocidicus TaxID=66423 RepID=A0A2N8NTW9_STREU|nr:hypothetical protein [Streptomyces eurocidicus]MBB5119297.1 hypothetical protein [Streptomyces eurocidicus]MBF6053118.1 hypothetical protein [Streptomyces eurocidicus]PNE32223.1 hypothetical protein AF335_21195 [Streptomyces eurocidicus]
MSHKTTTLRFALACATALAAVSATLTGPPAEARALAPACPPPGGGTCSFDWTDINGARNVELNPEIGRCYDMSPGAVGGTNHTNRTVKLWPNSDCSGTATGQLAAGASWNDRTHPFASFKP